MQNSTTAAGGKANDKLWGGRFSKATDELAERYLATSLVEDRLVPHDIAGSLAHAQMLSAQGIISREECEQIAAGLEQIAADFAAGKWAMTAADEDVHMAIERRLRALTPAAGKLHTARSRNDQIALDERLYLRAALAELSELSRACMREILRHARTHECLVMPGHTHLQIAQPVAYAHWAMAYFWMLSRDVRRFGCIAQRLDECPLGAAALAGTTFAIDRHATAAALGFARPSENSIDTVSDRDYMIEAANACAIAMSHLSRLCEELVIFSSSEFGFITLDDAFCTGSSIMPQKKNPDVCEKMRGKMGRVVGNLVALLTLMKGLPLAYNTDMSEDKRALFDSIDVLGDSLRLAAGVIATMAPNAARMRECAAAGFSDATDLADYLAKGGVAFRTAHEIAGRAVALALAKGCTLADLSLAEYAQLLGAAGCDGALAAPALYDAIALENIVAARKSYGGTAALEAQFAAAERALAGE